MNQTTKYAPTTNIIIPNWIILDTLSTISSIIIKNIFQNIQTCDAGEELRAYSNGGHQDYDHTKTLKMSPFEFFFNNKSLANKLYFAAVVSKFRITIGIELDQYINIHLNNFTRIIFKQCW